MRRKQKIKEVIKTKINLEFKFQNNKQENKHSPQTEQNKTKLPTVWLVLVLFLSNFHCSMFP